MIYPHHSYIKGWGETFLKIQSKIFSLSLGEDEGNGCFFAVIYHVESVEGSTKMNVWGKYAWSDESENQGGL